MADKKGVVITLRVPNQLLDRVEDLRDVISKQREFALKSKLNRSDLLRYLLLQGIESMEHESPRVVSDRTRAAAKEGRSED